MARQIRFAPHLIGAVLLAANASSYAAAQTEMAASGEGVATTFVDLSARAPSAPAPAAAAVPVTMRYYDLSMGAVQERPMPAVPAERGTATTRYIDLTSGDGAIAQEPPTQLRAIEITASPDPGDPYEESNRGRFQSHVALHRNIIDPVETVYIDGVPEPARVGLHNFLTNLETPSVFMNDVLQGQIGGAAATLSRFVVNSTVGIGGILDVGAHIGLSYRDNDFGRTLAAYGVGDGPYLLVPVIGPSNPRDLTGKVVDFALDPLHYIALPGGIVTSIGHAGAHEVDKRSFDVGALDVLDRTAPDPYLAEKTQARARRNAETATYTVPR